MLTELRFRYARARCAAEATAHAARMPGALRARYAPRVARSAAYAREA